MCCFFVVVVFFFWGGGGGGLPIFFYAKIQLCNANFKFYLNIQFATQTINKNPEQGRKCL